MIDINKGSFSSVEEKYFSSFSFSVSKRPSHFDMTTVANELPTTLTTVRAISRIRSIPATNARPSSGIPTVPNVASRTTNETPGTPAIPLSPLKRIPRWNNEGLTFEPKTVYRIAMRSLIGLSIMSLPAAAFTTLPELLQPLLSNGMLIGILVVIFTAWVHHLGQSK